MYRVLYRKYRPQTFTEVVGQKHVTATLQNELEGGRLSHAYLFTGTRGTGKTTCARLLSRAVNCLAPKDGNPCNECEICRELLDGTLLDVIEIDAASNSGVDNIRDLCEEANFTPVRAKYRVYIIDEVHMLTTQAFNALLKIMEEPPSHVIFILATTEVHKIPATILSRCQRFDFHRLPAEQIAAQIADVAKQEGTNIEPEAAALVARIADGAMRDALSLLDRCLAQLAQEETLTAQSVTRAAGLAGKERLFALTDCFARSDTAAALQLLNELHSESCDMEQLCTALLFHLRDLMIVKTVKSAEEILICTREDFLRFAEQSKNFSLERILQGLHILEDALFSIKREMNKRILLELCFVRLCADRLENDNFALASRIAALEKKIDDLQGNVTSAPVREKIATGRILTLEEEEAARAKESAQAEPEKTPLSPPDPEYISEEETPEQSLLFPPEAETLPPTADSAQWNAVFTALQRSSPALYSMFAGLPVTQRGNAFFVLAEHPALEQLLRIPTHKNDLESAMKTALDMILPLHFSDNAPEDTPPTPQPPVSPLLDLKQKLNQIDNP